MSGALPVLPLYIYGRRQLYRMYVAPDKFEQIMRIMRFDVSKSADLRGINLKNTCLAWCVYIFIDFCITFILYLFIHLLNHSFNRLFICLLFTLLTCLFVRSLHYSLIHLLIQWLTIRSHVSTELINSTKEKSALGRLSGWCKSNNKTDVRIGYMQLWIGYSWRIQPSLEPTGITWPGVYRYSELLYQVKKKKNALCGDHVRPVSPWPNLST
jgi:hypothetical protein